MNAASVVSTSSSSHRNARMMFDMMPSEPLPAITFSTFRSYSLRQHLAQVQSAVRVQVQFRSSRPHRFDGARRGSQRVFVRRQLDHPAQAVLALHFLDAAAGLIRTQRFDIRRNQGHLYNMVTGRICNYMANTTFKGVLVTQQDGKFHAAIEDIPREQLPARRGADSCCLFESELQRWSRGHRASRASFVRFRWFPASTWRAMLKSRLLSISNPVMRWLLPGCGTSEIHWGGYAQMARLKAEWVVPIPAESRQTVDGHGYRRLYSYAVRDGAGGSWRKAGRAGNCGHRRSGRSRQRLHRDSGEAGIQSGRLQRARGLNEYLKGLGAHEVIDRGVLSAASKRPMETERWGGAIDSVGGDTLAGLLRGMSAGTSIAACGVAGGANVATTVFPFILRGVNLLGIDSLRVSNARRREIWARIATDLDLICSTQ